MLGVQSASEAPEFRRNQFSSAAADLDLSFRLSNRGASAVVYLLDSLLHVLEFDESPEVRDRVDAIVASLSDEEKRNRGVLTLLGQHWFARSFRETGDSRNLYAAIRALGDALHFPIVFAFDDAFIRLIRGQALVRLSMAGEELDASLSLTTLDDAIADLSYAFETLPTGTESRDSQNEPHKNSMVFILNRPSSSQAGSWVGSNAHDFRLLAFFSMLFANKGVSWALWAEEATS
jgi:hypothetical protein